MTLVDAAEIISLVHLFTTLKCIPGYSWRLKHAAVACAVITLNRTNHWCRWRTSWFTFLSVSMNHASRRAAGLAPSIVICTAVIHAFTQMFFLSVWGVIFLFFSSFALIFCVCADESAMQETFRREGKANRDQPAHVERHGCSLMWLQLRSPGPNEVPWRLRCSSFHRLRTSSPHTATAQDH